MLGIIGAMDVEVAKLKEKLENVEIITKAGMEFNKGTFEGKDVVIVRSGIGKVNAGICTQILVDLFNVSAIINTGIAGSLKNEINIGDIVISTDALQHDVDATNFGYELGFIPQMKVKSFEADKNLIALAKDCCHSALPEIGVFEGRVVSGDQFIADKAKKDYISENFQGFCTEMEGAAIAQAAYLNDVPFVVIRAISDKADDSASMDYPTFEAMAVENSVKLLSEFIRKADF